MTQFPQFFPLEVREELNRITWGLSATVSRKLRDRGHAADVAPESAKIISIHPRTVWVEYNGVTERVNFMSKKALRGKE